MQCVFFVWSAIKLNRNKIVRVYAISRRSVTKYNLHFNTNRRKNIKKGKETHTHNQCVWKDICASKISLALLIVFFNEVLSQSITFIHFVLMVFYFSVLKKNGYSVWYAVALRFDFVCYIIVVWVKVRVCLCLWFAESNPMCFFRLFISLLLPSWLLFRIVLLLLVWFFSFSFLTALYFVQRAYNAFIPIFFQLQQTKR